MTTWHPTSWQQKFYEQSVEYPATDSLQHAIQTLSELPSLVTALEVCTLKEQLAKASKGQAFLLQGGDCAEGFADCNTQKITNKIRILLQMSLILIHGLGQPVIRVGRIAGQYAKPRSSPIETIEGVSLPSYRGDLINSPEFELNARTPDPERLLQGYFSASSTLNYIRALVSSGFADLRHAEYWDLEFAKHAEQVSEYQKIVERIQASLRFINTVGGDVETLKRVEFYTSHEALHLPYEQALTHQGVDKRWYNLSTHFPWVGMRTARLDGAHIEYLRGIANPIAVKVGPKATCDWLMQLVEVLNPQNEPGRLTLITRLGAEKVAELLPEFIQAVRKTGIEVLWCCDPMHGNTISTAEGYKTRRFSDILAELSQTFAVHRQCNSHLGGVHFELTGENVTECVGGARGLQEGDLKRAYTSLVDPRLNYEQALEMALLMVNVGL